MPPAARRDSPGVKVTLELSPAQVHRVLGAARSAGSVSVMPSGLRAGFAAERSELQDRRLSQSLIAGLVILALFPADGSSLGVS